MRILGGNAACKGGDDEATTTGEPASTGTKTASLTQEIALGVPAPVRPPRILVLEDEQALQTLVTAILKVRGLECDLAGTVREARGLMAQRAYDLVLADVHLPDGSGLSLAKESRGGPLLIVMTGTSDIQTAVHAIREGAIDFITKPFSAGQFLKRIDNALQEWKSRESLKGYAKTLETLVQIKGEELSRSSRKIDEVYDMTVVALGAALNLKDHETADHCSRVSLNSIALGAELALSEFELKNLAWGAYLHDVGKIGIPEQVLLKNGPLTFEERRTMQRHPSMGHEMIRDIEFLRFARDVVLCHHESFDGSGYPRGLRGDHIPLEARIFSVMDALDAMTSDRPYRAALPFSDARAELQRSGGTKFDPEIVQAFLGMQETSWKIQAGMSGAG